MCFEVGDTETDAGVADVETGSARVVIADSF